jgi:hypothetical protein
MAVLTCFALLAGQLTGLRSARAEFEPETETEPNNVLAVTGAILGVPYLLEIGTVAVFYSVWLSVLPFAVAITPRGNFTPDPAPAMLLLPIGGPLLAAKSIKDNDAISRWYFQIHDSQALQTTAVALAVTQGAALAALILAFVFEEPARRPGPDSTPDFPTWSLLPILAPNHASLFGALRF